MISKSDLRRHSEPKFCVYASFMRFYLFTNFIRVEGGRVISCAISHPITLITSPHLLFSSFPHLGVLIHIQFMGLEA